MKTTFIKIFTIMAFVAFTSCGDKAKEATTTEAEKAAVSEMNAVNYAANAEKIYDRMERV